MFQSLTDHHQGVCLYLIKATVHVLVFINYCIHIVAYDS